VPRPLSAAQALTVYAVQKKGRVLSGFADYTIQQFRRELTRAERTLAG